MDTTLLSPVFIAIRTHEMMRYANQYVVERFFREYIVKFVDVHDILLQLIL